MKHIRKQLQTSRLHTEATKRYNELLRVKKICERSLAKAPEGKIHIIKSRPQAQFYLRKDTTDKSGCYLSRKNTEVIRQYVQKAYDEDILKLIEEELSYLEYYLNHSGDIQDDIRRVYSDIPSEIKNMISAIDCSDEDYTEIWLAKPYTGKEIGENVPYYETAHKERVRSKSELTIANALAARGVPYKYECPLLLRSGKTIYPDFTVLDVKNRREIYWEHRGMMDDRDYARHAILRAKLYINEGYMPGRDLIFSEEMATAPLGTDEIEAIIENYFL